MKILKNKAIVILYICFVYCNACSPSQENPPESWIRINQLGYRPQDVKVAVLVSKGNLAVEDFQLIDAHSQEVAFTSDSLQAFGEYGPFTSTFRLNFSAVAQEGTYYLQANNTQSPEFRIAPDVYEGTADFLLRYMRQQRCGFNPFLKDSCHTQDGFTIYGPMPDGTHIDVTGGWHDATDYLQYVPTSANAAYNLLFAYRDFPAAFADQHLENGLEGENNIPDVLDEAKWGLDWLVKMHPREDWMFTQIADDRDHAGFRLPTEDTVNYGKGLERPVYFNSGEAQGLFAYQNHTQGTASMAGKFAAAFALGAMIYRDKDPEYAALLAQKARTAYAFGLQKPGYTQTAPGRAPYFYEEENWVDDMELGAAALLALTNEKKFEEEGLKYGEQEPVTPWMQTDTARHYQWYPFLNIGHYELARQVSGAAQQQLISFYKEGLEVVWQRANKNAFYRGVPFIWCSNNLTAAFITQNYLYRKLTDDTTYLEMEAAMRDWLFGCNPWGVSMIIGLPSGGKYPLDPHSSLTHLYDYKLDGALIDGPVYGAVFNNLRGLTLHEEDEYAAFQSDLVVYHDDVGDYSTNEPTMDGVATLIYYLAALH